MALAWVVRSIHRGGAIFLDGTEDIIISNVSVDHAGGNGIFLSNHAWRTTIANNTVGHAGDSAIVLVGSTDLM
jgi:parallel beta-helix repeat protein